MGEKASQDLGDGDDGPWRRDAVERGRGTGGGPFAEGAGVGFAAGGDIELTELDPATGESHVALAGGLVKTVRGDG